MTISGKMQASEMSYQLNQSDLVQEIELVERRDHAESVNTVFVHWLKFVKDEILWTSLSDGCLCEYDCSKDTTFIVRHLDVAVVQACLSQ